MTPDRYFEMQEQMGHEIVEEDIPPGLEDFPDIINQAIDIFNQLGDRAYPEIGYIGKDYTLLDTYIKLGGIEEHESDFFMEVLQWLDARAIKKSAEQLKREYDKIKRKK